MSNNNLFSSPNERIPAPYDVQPVAVAPEVIDEDRRHAVGLELAAVLDLYRTDDAEPDDRSTGPASAPETLTAPEIHTEVDPARYIGDIAARIIAMRNAA